MHHIQRCQTDSYSNITILINMYRSTPLLIKHMVEGFCFHFICRKALSRIWQMNLFIGHAERFIFGTLHGFEGRHSLLKSAVIFKNLVMQKITWAERIEQNNHIRLRLPLCLLSTFQFAGDFDSQLVPANNGIRWNVNLDADLLGSILFADEHARPFAALQWFLDRNSHLCSSGYCRLCSWKKQHEWSSI